MSRGLEVEKFQFSLNSVYRHHPIRLLFMNGYKNKKVSQEKGINESIGD
jgi:hypothetical protein